MTTTLKEEQKEPEEIVKNNSQANSLRFIEDVKERKEKWYLTILEK
ncbi:MAG: hypothetical protein QW166_00395 [Candidatus Bathyarchaeia archaeon]